MNTTIENGNQRLYIHAIKGPYNYNNAYTICNCYICTNRNDNLQAPCTYIYVPAYTYLHICTCIYVPTYVYLHIRTYTVIMHTCRYRTSLRLVSAQLALHNPNSQQLPDRLPHFPADWQQRVAPSRVWYQVCYYYTQLKHAIQIPAITTIIYTLNKLRHN